MAKTVTAAIMREPHAPIEMGELPWPDLVPGSAMLRTMYSEVCGTDVHLHHGRLAGVPYPIVPGHVFHWTSQRNSGHREGSERCAVQGR